MFGDNWSPSPYMLMGALLPPFTGVFFSEESASNKSAMFSINTSHCVTNEKYFNNDRVIDQAVNTPS